MVAAPLAFPPPSGNISILLAFSLFVERELVSPRA
jgi:hypothetical protein